MFSKSRRLKFFSSRMAGTVATLVFAATLLTAPVSAQTTTPLPLVPVFATFTFADKKPVRVFVTNSQTIQQLYDISIGKSQDMIPNGLLLDDRPGHSPYDPQWSWHYQPDSLQMSNFTIEVCDGTPSYIESHLDDWFQGQKEARWCGWSAHLTKLEWQVSGDVNNDQSVNLADVQRAINGIIGPTPLNDAERSAADVYPAAGTQVRPGDGTVDIRDVILLLRKAIGLA